MIDGTLKTNYKSNMSKILDLVFIYINIKKIVPSIINNPALHT